MLKDLADQSFRVYFEEHHSEVFDRLFGELARDVNKLMARVAPLPESLQQDELV